MLLPAPLPDELFASVLARLGRLNGMGDFREVAECCFGLEVCPSFVDAKLNLPEFCVRFSYAYGAPETLLEQLTALGARRCLGEYNDKDWNALIRGDASTSIGELTFFGAVELRFCALCCEENIEQYGMSYWHRMHQLPILHRCAVHGCRLKKAPLKRVALHQSFPLPHDFSEGRIDVEPPFDWHGDFETRLAVFSNALLNSAPQCPDIAGQALLEELWGQRLLKSNGLPRINELLEFLAPRILNDIKAELPEEYVVGFRPIMRSIRQPAKGLAFGRALLLCAMFGNWRIVEERCKWADVFGTTFDGNPRMVRTSEQQDVSSLKDLHRQKCLAYIADNAKYSRKDFTKQHYRSFRWLLYNDAAWLDHYLPIVDTDTEQRELFH